MEGLNTDFVLLFLPDQGSLEEWAPMPYVGMECSEVSSSFNMAVGKSNN